MVGDCHRALDVTQSRESPCRVLPVVGLPGTDLVHLPISKGHQLPPSSLRPVTTALSAGLIQTTPSLLVPLPLFCCYRATSNPTPSP